MENTPTQEIITKLINWIESTADFAKEQWPDYVAQYMRAAIMKSWVDLISISFVIIILVFVGIFCIYFTWKWEGKSYDIPFPIQMGTFMPFLGTIPCVGILVSEVHNIINLYVAPKVYMLTHLRSFLK